MGYELSMWAQIRDRERQDLDWMTRDNFGWHKDECRLTLEAVARDGSLLAEIVERLLFRIEALEAEIARRDKSDQKSL